MMDAMMDDEQWNLAVRRFLKRFGIRAQHQLDEARQRVLKSGGPARTRELELSVVLRCPALELEFEVNEPPAGD